MSPIRKKTAEHMVLSKRTSAHVSTVFEIDFTRIDQLRHKHRAAFEERGVKLTYMPFVLKAVVDALAAFPVLNASIDGDNVVYRKDVNLGIAVALDWGLIVPVIHHADEKNVLGLARAAADLAERARAKKLKVEEVQGGTFTITNPGVFGSLFGTPIINQPQVAILGLGTIEKRPVVRDDAIAIRTMAYVGADLRPPPRGRRRRRPLHGPRQEDAAGVRRIVLCDVPSVVDGGSGGSRYARGLELQEGLVAERQAGRIPDQLLLLEHDPVFTLGRNARAENVLFPAEALRERGFEVFETGRGGDVTYHGPGQVVGYPILDLSPDRRDVHRYVRDLEEVMIRTCADYGLAASRVAGLTGTWVGDEKIGAIGVRIARWVTSHGFAFNVATDLSAFDLIVPCGIRGRGVTSLERRLGRPVPLDEVMDRLAAHFAAVFERSPA